jgi:hypothetical protein
MDQVEDCGGLGEHEGDEGDEVEAHDGLGQAFVVASEAPGVRTTCKVMPWARAASARAAPV